MHRPGANTHNVQPSDVLCDFCHGSWDGASPVVEGHHGSIICGACLTIAYTRLVVEGNGSAPAGYSCTMCLEQREEAGWQSPAHPDACICRRCANQSARVLDRDPDYDWERPDRAKS